MPKNAEVCRLLDILTLDMLDLIQQQVQCKVDIEKHKNEGDILLAKARYIQGVSSVSSSQLPTENSGDFQALTTIAHSADESTGAEKFQIEKHPVSKEAGYVNPVHWFGVLVPRCLQMARDMFDKTLELVVESANIQNELRNCICGILSLKKVKYDIE